MNIIQSMNTLFGIGVDTLSIWHMIARVLAIYIIGIIIARLNKKFVAFPTANSFFLFILIGSVLASSIVGALFYETLGIAIFIILLNWFIVMLGYYSHTFNRIIQGNPIVLVDNGIILTQALNKCFITERDSFLITIKNEYF